MPRAPFQPTINSDRNRSVRVELDKHLHPPLLEVLLVERRLAQLALLVLLDEEKRVAEAGTAGVRTDAGAAAKGCLGYCFQQGVKQYKLSLIFQSCSSDILVL